MTSRRPLICWSLFLATLVTVAVAQTDKSPTENMAAKYPESRSAKTQYHHVLSAPGAIMDQQKKMTQDTVYVEALNDVEYFFQTISGFVSSVFQSRRGSSSPPPDIFGGSFLNEALAKGEADLFEAVKEALRTRLRVGGASDRCVNDTGYLVASMLQGEGWALNFLDATGKPVPGITLIRFNYVGDYFMCRDQLVQPNNYTDGFTGNYCTLKADIGPPSDNPLTSIVIQWGVCMPSTCSETENTIFFDEFVTAIGLNDTLTVVQAEDHNEHRTPKAATYASAIIIILIGSLMIVGTVYDVVYLQWPVWRAEVHQLTDSEATANGHNVQTANGGSSVRTDDDDPLLGKASGIFQKPAAPKGKLGQTLLAFSVYTNASKVLSTKQGQGAITCLHGLRFLSLTWVMLGHTVVYGAGQIGNSVSELGVILESWTFDVVTNAFPSVDTFYTISGLLTAYGTMTGLKKTGWKINWGKFYFHRFWRLTPPYALSIVLVMGLIEYCGHGANWPQHTFDEFVHCEKYWWTNLLYINNLIHKNETCFGHTWYLANDMQFYIVSPLMIIPFYFNQTLGIIVGGIFILVSMITTGVLSVQNQWPPSIALFNSPGYPTYFTDYYLVPWTRIGPFVLGILTGCYLATKPFSSIKLKKVVVFLGWLVAAVLALWCVYGLRGDLSGNNPSSIQFAAFYNAVSRTVWGAVICWLVVCCVSGWGGPVNALLSWSPFVPLGRLTYMAYLIHPYLIYIYHWNLDNLIYINGTTLALTYMGVVFISFTLAFAGMLALESPWVGLEKVFLPSRKKE